MTKQQMEKVLELLRKALIKEDQDVDYRAEWLKMVLEWISSDTKTDKKLEKWPPLLATSDINWIVNQLGELGVRIGTQNFFLYKGSSLLNEYVEDLIYPTKEDIASQNWAFVLKREFGESCISPNYLQNRENFLENHMWYNQKGGNAKIGDEDV